MSERLSTTEALACLARADEHHGAIIAALRTRTLNPDLLRWHYIQLTLERNEGNVSETARQLGMHRRTLQRIRGKRQPPKARANG